MMNIIYAELRLQPFNDLFIDKATTVLNIFCIVVFFSTILSTILYAGILRKPFYKKIDADSEINNPASTADTIALYTLDPSLTLHYTNMYSVMAHLNKNMVNVSQCSASVSSPPRHTHWALEHRYETLQTK